MLLHSISFCVFCVRVGISDSLCSEWVAGPPTIEVIKACGNVFFFFVSSKRHIWPMPVHIGLRLTQALDRCRALPYSIQIDTRLSFLHIRSQLRSLTVGDQAYSKSNVPEKTPLRLSPRKTGLMRNSMLSRSKKSRSQINNLDSPCPPGRQIKIWSLGNQVCSHLQSALS